MSSRESEGHMTVLTYHSTRWYKKTETFPTTARGSINTQNLSSSIHETSV